MPSGRARRARRQRGLPAKARLGPRQPQLPPLGPERPYRVRPLERIVWIPDPNRPYCKRDWDPDKHLVPALEDDNAVIVLVTVLTLAPTQG